MHDSQWGFHNGLAETMMDKNIDLSIRKQALETSTAENAAEIIEKQKSRNLLQNNSRGRMKIL